MTKQFEEFKFFAETLLLRRACWVFLSWLSLVSVTVLSLIPVKMESIAPFTLGDKVAHLVAYCCIGLCFRLGYPVKRRDLILFAILLYSLLIEYIQVGVGRSFDLFDLLANGLGLLLGGLFLGRIFTRLFQKIREGEGRDKRFYQRKSPHEKFL